MKKIITWIGMKIFRSIKMLILMLTVFNADAQTNALATEAKLFLTVTPLQAFAVTSTPGPGYPYLPAPIYDEKTSWGKCMNAKIRGCAAMWSCGVLCGTSVVTAQACTAGWAVQCAIFKDQTIKPIVPPKKIL